MTLTLHVLWHQRRLHLWGEPASDTETLRAAVGAASTDPLLAEAAEQSQLQVWLPRDESGPIASHAVSTSSEHHQSSLMVSELAAMTVSTLAFSPAQAIDLLSSWCSDGSTSCGPSTLFWTELSKFVIDLLVRRQFVPNLMDSDEGFIARWRPVVLDRDELDWLERMVSAMPHCCRAVSGGETDPGTLVDNFLAATADALIRRCVSEDTFFRQPAERLASASLAADMRPPETRWLAALLEHDPHVPGSHEENQTLARLAQGWVGQLEPATAVSNLRLIFKLEEPDEDAEAEGTADLAIPTAPWMLRFLLQTSDQEDPIDAEEIWGQGSDAAMLGRRQQNRQNRLLTELSRAAQLFPLLAAALQNASPCALPLQTGEAYTFLRQWSPMLRDQGFGVLLPPWMERAGSELGLRLQVRPMDEANDDWVASQNTSAERQPLGESLEMTSGHFGLSTLLQFDWQIAVGDLTLSPAEFQRLAGLQTPLVKVRGQWVQIDIDAAAKADKFLREQQENPSLTLGDAMRTVYGTSKQETGLTVLGLGGSSWIDQLLQQAPGFKLQSQVQPPAFKGMLRPYQLRGMQWLIFLDRLGIGACLADDMGLGKTIQLIALLQHEREIPADSTTPAKLGPTLLFAPTSVVGNWLRELQRFAPELKVLVHHGPQRQKEKAFADQAAECDVVITSYALAHRDRDELKQVRWWRIVLDEAQKIKNPTAAGTQAIRSLLSGRRVALTGTPIENHLSELWSIMEVLNPGLLGSAGEFREKFAVPVEKLGDRERADQLRRLIRPFVLRRLKSDPEIAGDLPEKMESKVFCNLTGEQAAHYERLVGQSLTQIDAATGIRRRGLILSVLTRLKQMCDHPALVLKDENVLDGRSGKCERLIEMLEEVLEEGDAALVFSQFREMGRLLEIMIKKRLGNMVQFLHGGTTAKQRDAMIERFQQPNSDIKIFLLSLRAGGLGLNLTAANHVFHFDRWWNPAVESQATDRAHRVGQTRKVQVHKFVCIGNMEERIDRLLSDKLALADKIVGSGDEWLTDMSTDQLREYLSLSQEAVGEF
jgi:superfamily II DNA or RNA helicase